MEIIHLTSTDWIIILLTFNGLVLLVGFVATCILLIMLCQAVALQGMGK